MPGDAQIPPDAAKFGGKRLKVFTDQVSWHEAKNRCAALGGKLCVVTNDKENDFICRLISDAKLEGAWNCATDEKQEGEWVWPNNAKVAYTNWAPNQPNNGGARANEHYAVMLVHDGKWCDQPDDPREKNVGFVCQWE